MLDPTDTIAAVASPSGLGFRGLVRITGPDALSIALAPFSDGDSAAVPKHACWRSGSLRVDGLRPVLPVSIALWPGQRTYTGQPLAEIHTIGSPPLVNLVLAQCLTLGARHAEPGEFTLRAFLSGRLDLTRAEAVLGVIEARNSAQLDAALEQLAGGLAGPIESLRDQLVDHLAHLEANLDFAEEPDVDPLGRATLAAHLADSATQVIALAERLDERDRPEGHPRVVLTGPPNAGKSRLYNALIGKSHALVSPIAGTTRDYLSALCDCNGLTIELVDTAGAEPAFTAIEDCAQAMRTAQSARADLILACESADLGAAVGEPSNRPRLRVWTKCDLAQAPAGFLATSAESGEGIPALRAAIASNLRQQSGGEALVSGTGARCRESLIRAGRSLSDASQTIVAGGGDELVAVDLHQAIDDLGRVVGAIVTDDILDRIFRRFCIGK